MAKTQEELDVLKEEVETVCKKLNELTEVELKHITGGIANALKTNHDDIKQNPDRYEYLSDGQQ